MNKFEAKIEIECEFDTAEEFEAWLTTLLNQVAKPNKKYIHSVRKKEIAYK